jgi:hypothetical protein
MTAAVGVVMDRAKRISIRSPWAAFSRLSRHSPDLWLGSAAQGELMRLRVISDSC